MGLLPQFEEGRGGWVRADEGWGGVEAEQISMCLAWWGWWLIFAIGRMHMHIVNQMVDFIDEELP